MAFEGFKVKLAGVTPFADIYTPPTGYYEATITGVKDHEGKTSGKKGYWVEMSLKNDGGKRYSVFNMYPGQNDEGKSDIGASKLLAILLSMGHAPEKIQGEKAIAVSESTFVGRTVQFFHEAPATPEEKYSNDTFLPRQAWEDAAKSATGQTSKVQAASSPEAANKGTKAAPVTSKADSELDSALGL